MLSGLKTLQQLDRGLTSVRADVNRIDNIRTNGAAITNW
jgi:hypothetical protein